MDAEQFSLKWNNFHSNLTSGFHALLQGEDLVDVTFAVEGKFLQAHKLVLSVCSPYFKQMFKIHPDKHPIIILKGVAYNDLSDILLFMYQGEVNVRQENLANFLKTAELLQIKGLTEDDSSNEQSKPEVQNEKETSESLLSQFRYQDNVPKEHVAPTNRSITPQPIVNSPIVPKRTNASPQHNSEPKKIRPTKVEDISSDALDLNVTPKSEPAYMDEDYESSSGMADFAQLMESSQKDLANVPPGLMPPLASSILQDSTQLDHDFSASQFMMKKSYVCPLPNCGRSFTLEDSFRKHVDNQHGKDRGPFICEFCNRPMKNKNTLFAHMYVIHKRRRDGSLLEVQPNPGSQFPL